MTATLGVVAIALALAWKLGGLALRVGGALVFWIGLLGLAATGNPQAITVALVGALAWLVGQAHFALRHGGTKSPLARVLLAALWRWLARATARIGGTVDPSHRDEAPTGIATEHRWWL